METNSRLHWSPGSVGLGGECPHPRPEALGVSVLLGKDWVLGCDLGARGAGRKGPWVGCMVG